MICITDSPLRRRIVLGGLEKRAQRRPQSPTACEELL
jgi:hypothetical protein